MKFLKSCHKPISINVTLTSKANRKANRA
jgi:hypothetical protein